MSTLPLPSLNQTAIRTAFALSWFTIFYNIAEGVVSIFFGVAEESLALFGFGADSLIEVASAGIVLWRFRGESGRSAGISLERERRATLSIGWLFIGLAAITILGCGYQLVTLGEPDTTLPGMIISAASLSFMGYLFWHKRVIALRLDSSTMMNDARCSLACLKLSAVLFAGSLIFMLFPALWWADSAAAVGIAILVGKEGLDTIKHARSANFKGGCGCSSDHCSS